MRDKRIERLLAVGLVAVALSSVAVYALPNAEGGYRPTFPIRVNPPEEMRVLQAICYWNNLAFPHAPVFVIDRANPQVTWETGPWGARGPYPNTDNKWVIYHPAPSGSTQDWLRGEGHELGHVLFGANHYNEPGHGIMGPDGDGFIDDMRFDKKALKALIEGA